LAYYLGCFDLCEHWSVGQILDVQILVGHYPHLKQSLNHC
jgi:hypothetical protein